MKAQSCRRRRATRTTTASRSSGSATKSSSTQRLAPHFHTTRDLDSTATPSTSTEGPPHGSKRKKVFGEREERAQWHHPPTARPPRLPRQRSGRSSTSPSSWVRLPPRLKPVDRRAEGGGGVVCERAPQTRAAVVRRSLARSHTIVLSRLMIRPSSTPHPTTPHTAMEAEAQPFIDHLGLKKDEPQL